MRWKRPGIRKAAIFVSNFQHPLESNEWQVKWPVFGLKWKTYNPDFYCPTLKCYIECCTSTGNYLDSWPQWRQCIVRGRPLRVFWWQGAELTKHLVRKDHYFDVIEGAKLRAKRRVARENCKLGGAPRGPRKKKESR